MSARHIGRWARVALIFAATLMTGAAAAETAVRFTLDFRIEGPSAPFLLAIDRNYYKAEGLNVSIEPSAGSLESIERVASGEFDIGFADINALIKFRDTKPGTPIKAVFMVYNRPPFAVIGRKSRGIYMPKDLEGKILGAPAADSSFAQWPIFVQANNIDASKVTIENVSFPVREPMLAAGQVDAVTGISFSTYVDLKDKGVPVDDINVLLMADYGVVLYGTAIIVNSAFAAGNPDAVKGFLRAYLKSLKDTVRQPSIAIESVLKRNAQAKKNVELERLTMALRDNIVTPEVKMNGFGGVDQDRFARAVEQIALTYKFKAAKPKLDDVFDASFLPSPAERKFK
ncbi:MAG TPA: ABC transporter substrate-binding protein [Pseudolabrys sp.]|nr:ABC transporter substrate-binding protein [Pseudolabrys sp.]